MDKKDDNRLSKVRLFLRKSPDDGGEDGHSLASGRLLQLLALEIVTVAFSDIAVARAAMGDAKAPARRVSRSHLG